MVLATSGAKMIQSAHCNLHFLPISQAFVNSCAIPEVFTKAVDVFVGCREFLDVVQIKNSTSITNGSLYITTERIF